MYLFYDLEHVINGQLYYPGASVSSRHGVRLPSGRLPINKDGS